MVDHDFEAERQQWIYEFLNEPDEGMAFADATFQIASLFFMSRGRAEAGLRELCASGKVRSYNLGDPYADADAPEDFGSSGNRVGDLTRLA
jgi:hypothetical protein